MEQNLFQNEFKIAPEWSDMISEGLQNGDDVKEGLENSLIRPRFPHMECVAWWYLKIRALTATQDPHSDEGLIFFQASLFSEETQ